MTDYYVNNIIGNDGDTGLAGHDWLTIYHANNNTIGGDHIYVQHTGTSYSAQDTGGGSAILYIVGSDACSVSANKVFEGYYQTPGDGYHVTWDASIGGLSCAIQYDNVANNIDLYYEFRNFRFTGASTYGADIDLAQNIHFENCRFDNNNIGARCYYQCSFHRCQFDNNTNAGLSAHRWNQIMACVFHSNGGAGVTNIAGGSVISSLFYNNGSSSANIGITANTYNTTVWGNTIDGEGNAGSTGILITNSTANCTIDNNILFNCGTGISATSASPANFIGYNYFCGNDTDVSNVAAVADQINSISNSEDPFTDSTNRDYTLKAGSPAKNVGLEIDVTIALWS